MNWARQRRARASHREETALGKRALPCCCFSKEGKNCRMRLTSSCRTIVLCKNNQNIQRGASLQELKAMKTLAQTCAPPRVIAETDHMFLSLSIAYCGERGQAL